MPYEDPENLQEQLDVLHELPTLKEVKMLVDSIYPTWLVSVLSNYCDDYPHLTQTWENMCNAVPVKKASIILVDYLNFDHEHILIHTFAELLTRSGFSVRRKTEYNPCNVCGKAIPVEELYNVLKNTHNVSLPPVWKPNCSNC